MCWNQVYNVADVILILKGQHVLAKDPFNRCYSVYVCRPGAPWALETHQVYKISCCLFQTGLMLKTIKFWYLHYRLLIQTLILGWVISFYGKPSKQGETLPLHYTNCTHLQLFLLLLLLQLLNYWLTLHFWTKNPYAKPYNHSFPK